MFKKTTLSVAVAGLAGLMAAPVNAQLEEAVITATHRE
jgi:hypothetical protein